MQCASACVLCRVVCDWQGASSSCRMSVFSASSQPVAGTKIVDKQQLSEWQKRVRTELGRIRQQKRLKRSDEVNVSCSHWSLIQRLHVSLATLVLAFTITLILPWSVISWTSELPPLITAVSDWTSLYVTVLVLYCYCFWYCCKSQTVLCML